MSQETFRDKETLMSNESHLGVIVGELEKELPSNHSGPEELGPTCLQIHWYCS